MMDKRNIATSPCDINAHFLFFFSKKCSICHSAIILRVFILSENET